MSSDPRTVQNALHDNAALPGNFNLQNGRWEGSGGGGRTRLVFDPKTKKLLAVTPEQALDKFVGIDMAREGFFNLYDSNLESIYSNLYTRYILSY